MTKLSLHTKYDYVFNNREDREVSFRGGKNKINKRKNTLKRDKKKRITKKRSKLYKKITKKRISKKLKKTIRKRRKII